MLHGKAGTAADNAGSRQTPVSGGRKSRLLHGQMLAHEINSS
jgi:hypothetical protein